MRKTAVFRQGTKLRIQNIAVIGSGISGLSAAWLLSQKHHVTLIESEKRLGGHTNTVDVPLFDGSKLPIDTGFIVSNTWTYPNFSALMDYLDVPMVETAMTFSVSCDQGRYEYSGDHLGTLLGRARQWLSPTHWRLMADLVHFYKTAESRASALPESMTLGEYLTANNYSQAFVERHLLPVCGAIWSSEPAAMARYPLRAFIRFFANHKLFALGNRPLWRTVKGGSREYVKRLLDDSRCEVIKAQPVTAVRRHAFSVEVTGANGFHRHFDHAVIATHADQALQMLADPSPQEQASLATFGSSPNTAVLHRDETFMPRCRRFWSAWNYHGDEQPTKQGEGVAVTYWMNALQKLETPGLQNPSQHFVTLNPRRAVAPDKIDGVFAYRHPVFSRHTSAAQERLWDLQGINRTWFAGAWFGAGFHEDGLQAGLAVAEQLGGLSRPWTVADQSSRIHVGAVPVLPPMAEAAE
jgi:uncharacterized protein